MEKLRFANFAVHIDTSERTLLFAVFPVIDWENLIDKTTGTSYVVRGSPCDTLDYFDEELAEKRFEGSFCWRGVWEGRLYFTSEEYWGDELKEMADIYENYIVPWCKEFIKKRDPGWWYED